jgi:hypothetical protein
LGGTATLLGVAYTGDRVAVWRLGRQELGLKVRAARLEVERLELRRHVLNFDHNQRLIIPVEHAHKLTVIDPTGYRPLEAPLPELPTVASLNFLDILPKLQTCMVVGGQNSGKTTLLHNVAQSRLQAGVVLALDPHSDQWTNGVAVVGTGRDYAGIGAMLDKLAQLLDSRYKRQQAGKLITIVCDEWLSIVDNVPEAAQSLKLLLTEGRKVNLHLFLGSHSDRARQLGLNGLADLRDGVSLVYLNWQPATGNRTAEIVMNGGERQAIITPGPVGVSKQPVLRLNTRRQVNSTETEVLERYAQGEQSVTLPPPCLAQKAATKTNR